MIKTFKEFIKDYQEYYQCKDFRIKTEEDMEDVVYNIYGLLKVDIDYENKIIEIW